MEADGKPTLDQFHFYIFLFFFLPSFSNRCIIKYPILQKSQLCESHFSWEYSYLSFFTLDSVMWEVSTKVGFLGALHAHLRLDVTGVWSSNDHIPELPTEGTHLCLENSMMSRKVKEYFGISLQAQTDSAYSGRVTPLIFSGPTCRSGSNAQAFSIFGTQPGSVNPWKMPWNLVLVTMHVKAYVPF